MAPASETRQLKTCDGLVTLVHYKGAWLTPRELAQIATQQTKKTQILLHIEQKQTINAL